MSRPTIIFDYDLTLSPGESLADVIGLAIDSHRDGAELRRRFDDLQGRWQEGPRTPADLLTAFRLVRAIRRSHIDAYVDTRRRLPDDLGHVFDELRRRGVRLHIVSSAYRDWLLPIGRAWGFSDHEIHARYHLGWFGGAAHPLTVGHLLRSASKGRIIETLLRDGAAGRPLIVVGDSAEDLRAARHVAADGFVAAGYYAASPVDPPALPGVAVQRVGCRDALPATLLAAVARP
ncbi:phosphoglycolate phosphatase-like HAD superfamily hydrolase [Azospirillum fermentarium]|uniref:haloacid dehalogenase-like hydrolase n=1 Tax=Azospirillum fermentarium TaxID=1233114 RepID=UPI002225D1CA|nr:haloacid dehalogenase-like hydrolase [Azospirillum fermentarium]MCW2244449.1 phosphoglycolate phosphatase-like HAD superfamily hydrolase [Azospirillum fermentarium]